MRILIVEDDLRVGDFISRGLKSEGYVVKLIDNGVAGYRDAQANEYDVIILDLMLPDMSGTQICQALRSEGVSTPIMMLTAMDSMNDKITGLRMGADDYMTKPFSFDELVARIEALGRRAIGYSEGNSILEVDDLRFDLKAVRVWCCDKELTLTDKELAILELLMSKPGELFSRERILSNVWGMDTDPLTNVVDVYIAKLRKKIDCNPKAPHIETVRGRGYRLSKSCD